MHYIVSTSLCRTLLCAPAYTHTLCRVIFLFFPLLCTNPFGPRQTSTNFRNREVSFWTIEIHHACIRGEKRICILLPAIPKTSRSARFGRGKKTCIVYRCLIILRNVFWAPGAKETARAADYKIFLSFFLFFCFFFFCFFLLYATQKSTIKLISLFTICIILYPFSEGKRIFQLSAYARVNV